MKTTSSSSSPTQLSFWQCERCFFDQNIDEGPTSEQICLGCRKIRDHLIWSCSECTFHNAIGMKSCEVCGSICYQRDIQKLSNKNKKKQGRGGLNIHIQVNSKEIVNSYKSKKRKAVALISQKNISNHALLAPLNDESSSRTESSGRKISRTKDLPSVESKGKVMEKVNRKEKLGKDTESTFVTNGLDRRRLRSNQEDYSKIEFSGEQESNTPNTNLSPATAKKTKTRQTETASSREGSIRSKRGGIMKRQKLNTEYESDENEDEEEQIEIKFLKEEDVEEDIEKSKSNSNLQKNQMISKFKTVNTISTTNKGKGKDLSTAILEKSNKEIRVVEKDDRRKRVSSRNSDDNIQVQTSKKKDQKMNENATNLKHPRASKKKSSSFLSSTQSKKSLEKKQTHNKTQNEEDVTEAQLHQTQGNKQNIKKKDSGKKSDKDRGDVHRASVNCASKEKTRSSMNSMSSPYISDISYEPNKDETKTAPAPSTSLSITPIRTPSIALDMFRELSSLSESSTKDDVVRHHSLIWKYQLSSMHNLIGKVAKWKQISVDDFETQYFGTE